MGEVGNFARGLVRSQLLGQNPAAQLQSLRAGLSAVGREQSDLQEAIDLYQHSTSLEARRDFVLMIAGLMQNPAQQESVEQALAFLQGPSDRDVTRFGLSEVATEALLAKLRGRGSPQNLSAQVGDASQSSSRIKPSTPGMLATRRTVVTLSVPLTVDRVGEEELLRQIMAGDLRNVSVREKDVFFHLRKKMGILIKEQREIKGWSQMELARRVRGLNHATLSQMESGQMLGAGHYPGIETALGLAPDFFMTQIKTMGELEAVHLTKASKAAEIIVGHELKKLREQKGWSLEQLFRQAQTIDSGVGNNVHWLESYEKGLYWGRHIELNYSIFARALGQEPDYFNKLAVQHWQRLIRKDARLLLGSASLDAIWVDALRKIGEPVQSVFPTDEEGVFRIVTESGKEFVLTLQVKPKQVD